MSDKKDGSQPINIPPAVGKAIGSLSAGCIGASVAYELFEHENKLLSLEDLKASVEAGDLSAEEATQQWTSQHQSWQSDSFEPDAAVSDSIAQISATVGGALALGVAGYNLGAKNPSKSILVGATAVGAHIGLQKLHDHVDQVNHQNLVNANDVDQLDSSGPSGMGDGGSIGDDFDFLT